MRYKDESELGTALLGEGERAGMADSFTPCIK